MAENPATVHPRVLLVDDDDILREAYRRRLELAGFDVELASTGLGAITRVCDDRKPPIELVVLDLGLPDRSGFDVLAAIRERADTNTLPVIVVTGAEGLQQRLRSLAEGANDYLIKPVALDELVARAHTQTRSVAMWRARERAVTDVRRQIAIDLGRLGDARDVRSAGTILTHAVHRSDDIAGAAFVLQRSAGVVTCSVGDLAGTPGSVLTPHQEALLHDHAAGRSSGIERDALGLPGRGTVHALPLIALGEQIGVVLVALAGGLAPEPAQSALETVADTAILAGALVGPLVHRESRQLERIAHHERVIGERAFDTVFQPIVDLSTREIVGFEALTRFHDGTRPDLAFADAAAVGLQTELEQATAFAAIENADRLPEGAYLSINLSAATLLNTTFLSELTAGSRDVVIEITEHDAVEDYSQLEEALGTIRGEARVAVDDVGAGYAGLHHLRSLRPDIIKLDRSLVRGLEGDAVGRAMVTGMVYFARESGITLIGEGIELDGELATLLDLGVELGQGFLLGRPSPCEVRPGGDAGLESGTLV